MALFQIPRCNPASICTIEGNEGFEMCVKRATDMQLAQVTQQTCHWQPGKLEPPREVQLLDLLRRRKFQYAL